MALYDFGTITVFFDGQGMKVFTPYDPDLGQVIKKMKGQFKKDGVNSYWLLLEEASGMSFDEMLSSLEEFLKSKAPANWNLALEKFSAMSCLTSGFEIYAGIGGLRVCVPKDSGIAEPIKNIPDAKSLDYSKKKWVIPAASCFNATMKAVLERLSSRDATIFEDNAHPMSGRCILGTLALSEKQAEDRRLHKGARLCVPSAMVTAIDQRCKKPMATTFALKIVEMERIGVEDADVVLKYMDVESSKSFIKSTAAGNGGKIYHHLTIADCRPKWVPYIEGGL